MYVIELTTAVVVAATVVVGRWLAGPRDKGLFWVAFGWFGQGWKLRLSIGGLLSSYVALTILAGVVAHTQGAPTGRKVFRVRYLKPNFDAEHKLKKDDLVVSADGQHVTTKKALRALIQEKGKRPVAFEVERDGEVRTISLTPTADSFDQLRVGFSYEAEPEIAPPGWAGIASAVAFGPARTMASELAATIGAMWRDQTLVFPLRAARRGQTTADALHVGFRLSAWLWIALLIAELVIIGRHVLVE